MITARKGYPDYDDRHSKVRKESHPERAVFRGFRDPEGLEGAGACRTATGILRFNGERERRGDSVWGRPNAERENLIFLAPVPVNGDPFAPPPVGKEVDVPYVLNRCICGQINRLRYRVVCLPLEGGLKLHVLLGRNVEGRQKDPFDLSWNAWNLLNGPLLGNRCKHFPPMEPTFSRRPFKKRIYLEEPGPRQDISNETDCKERLNPARAPGDDADRSRGGDGVHRGIPGLQVPLGIDGLSVIREDPSFG